MNNLRLRLIWYIDSLIYSKVIFFIMLLLLVLWVVYSNFYINKNYIITANQYEKLIGQKVITIKSQSFLKHKDIDLYNVIINQAEENDINVKSYIMNKKIFIFSLVGSTDKIKNFVFKINELSADNKLKINKMDLSFEGFNKIGLVLEIQSYE
ncbi:TPA: hypothetical protein U9J56_001680 [Acinetobacter baumannii]|nr:hypothetical protein [Acinetobacter baumannii]